MIKKIAAAAVATSLIAAPVAANPAAALSLSPEVRAGEGMEGENEMFGSMVSTLLSLASTAVGLWLTLELIEDAESA